MDSACGDKWEQWTTIDEVYFDELQKYYEFVPEIHIGKEYFIAESAFKHLFVV